MLCSYLLSVRGRKQEGFGLPALPPPIYLHRKISTFASLLFWPIYCYLEVPTLLTNESIFSSFLFFPTWTVLPIFHHNSFDPNLNVLNSHVDDLGEIMNI